MQEFMNLFRFDSRKTLFLGVERECFLVRPGVGISAIAPDVLKLLPDKQRFGYELSACQLEERIGPCPVSDVGPQLRLNQATIASAEQQLGFQRLHVEVAPEDMPLDVFPDPTGRYQEITKEMPRDRLLAACRVAATHVHVGMPDHTIALKTYNRVIKHLDPLCQMGDGSDGERLRIYRTMAPDFMPRPYECWEQYQQEAVEKSFVEDPRRCWHLIRLSVHGTIEFRMFGTTSDLRKVEGWAKECHRLCEDAMMS